MTIPRVSSTLSGKIEEVVLDATVAPQGSALPTPPPTYRDRSGGLVGFGILQIILGGLVVLLIPVILLGALLSRRGSSPAPWSGFLMTIPGYLFTAAVLVTLGIGSIQARRWARALTLVISWFWLVMGIWITVLMTAIMPSMFAAGFRQAAQANPNAGAASMPTAVVAFILTFVIVLFAVFLIVVPAAFVLFYRLSDVAETCKARDPVPRWTDRAPLPVLGASLLYAYGAAYYLLMSLTTPVFPFFGRYLTGIPGAMGCLILVPFGVFLSIALFRLQLAGWWIAIVALVARTTSAVITYSRADLTETYSKLGWRGQQLEAMSQNPLIRGKIMLWWSVGYMVFFFVYLLWLKRYFRPAEVENPRVNPDSLAPGVL